VNPSRLTRQQKLGGQVDAKTLGPYRKGPGVPGFGGVGEFDAGAVSIRVLEQDPGTGSWSVSRSAYFNTYAWSTGGPAKGRTNSGHQLFQRDSPFPPPVSALQRQPCPFPGAILKLENDRGIQPNSPRRQAGDANFPNLPRNVFARL
jgi:hypothetical protein